MVCLYFILSSLELYEYCASVNCIDALGHCLLRLYTWMDIGVQSSYPCPDKENMPTLKIHERKWTHPHICQFVNKAFNDLETPQQTQTRLIVSQALMPINNKEERPQKLEMFDLAKMDRAWIIHIHPRKGCQLRGCDASNWLAPIV